MAYYDETNPHSDSDSDDFSDRKIGYLQERLQMRLQEIETSEDLAENSDLPPLVFSDWASF